MIDGSPMLGDVADFIRGVTYKPEDVTETFAEGSVVCMRTANVQATLDESSLVSIQRTLVKNDKKILVEGDLLVSTANSWNLVGKCCWVPRLGYAATAGGFIAILRGDDAKIDRRYLYRWFSSPKTQLEARNCGRQTTNISNMDVNRCLALRVPLPSLPEQRRIAAILDKADALRANRREAIAKLDQLVQSVFLDMFGDPVTNSHGFKVMELGEVASQVTDGAHHTPVREEQGIPLLSARNVLMGSIDFSNTDFVGQDEYERLRKRCEPLRGDILISCSGSIGRVARVSTDTPFVLVRSAALVKLKPDVISPAFIEYQLRTPFLQAQMQRSARSSSQANLFQKPIRELQIVVAPLAQQRRFESFVGEVQARRDVLVEAEEKVSSLISSLQSAAFQGKLLQ